jgi:prepilin-type processing-associated H-X9-DG protein
VIAILGLLAALLAPALSHGKAQAQRIRCLNNLRQRTVALHLYSDDNSFRYPFWNGSISKVPVYWHDLLEAYDSLAWTNRASHCPAYRGIIDNAQISAFPRGSYAYNCLGTSGTSFFVAPHNPRGLGWYPLTESAVSESDVTSPGEMYALSDARVYTDPSRPGSSRWTGLTWMNIGLSNPGEVQPFRHQRNYNVCFVDGHCSSVKRSDYTDAAKTGQNWNRDHQTHLGEPP